VLLAAILIPVISVLIGTWIEQAAIWSDNWRQVLRTAGTMSPFAASAHTLVTLSLEKVGGFMFKAWEEHKQRMAEARKQGLEQGLEKGREEGLAEAKAEYERRWERVREAVRQATGRDLDSLVNGNHQDSEATPPA
jgi:hypothetical protein